MEETNGVTHGSGNIFADLGLANAEEELAKAELGEVIRRAIERRGLTQAAAAKLMAESQPNVSMIIGGKLARFTLDRLLRSARGLGINVRINLSFAPENEPAHISVEHAGMP